MARFFGLVFGSQPEQPKALEVNVDTVYVRNKIERVIAQQEGDFEGWKYEETQYNLKEFQETMGKNTGVLKVDVADVAEVLTTTMLDTLSLGEVLAEVLETNATLKMELEGLKKQLNGGIQ